MRNPNRTTKRERRAVRRYNPYAARILGVAQAARWHREGILLDEARGLDNLVNDLKYGPVPLDLGDRVNAAIDAQRQSLARALGVGPDILATTSSHVNHFGVHDRKLALTEAINARQAGHGVDLTEPEPEPLGPSECGHYEVVDARINLNAICIPEALFAKYQAYREGRERGDAEGPWHDPNEAAAMHAEATENALNDDIEPGE